MLGTKHEATTMRRLILMRHAKSSWKTDASTDHARPLNKRGRRDAPRVATRLAELGWTPDWIASSDSARTTETLERMLDAMDYSGDVLFTRRLYEAGLEEISAVVSEVDDALRTVLVLGHNPGFEEALEQLTGESHPLKTANAALLCCEDSSWASAIRRERGWTIRELIVARALA